MYTSLTKFIFLLVTTLLGADSLLAQEFLPPVERFSGSKPAFLLTKTGERVDFILDDLDRKRGLIIKVSGNTTEGKKFTYQAADIQQLCLPPSDAAKYMSFMSSTQSIAKIQRTQVGAATRDLIVFYNEHLDDPDREVLVQLINPGFDSRIRVYDDPFATKTSGIGVGGIAITGGMDKSYYVRTKEGKVIRLKKRNYDELFRPLFDSCPAVMDKYSKNFAWRDFCYHVFLFDESCGLAK